MPMSTGDPEVLSDEHKHICQAAACRATWLGLSDGDWWLNLIMKLPMGCGSFTSTVPELAGERGRRQTETNLQISLRDLFPRGRYEELGEGKFQIN